MTAQAVQASAHLRLAGRLDNTGRDFRPDEIRRLMMLPPILDVAAAVAEDEIVWRRAGRSFSVSRKIGGSGNCALASFRFRQAGGVIAIGAPGHVQLAPFQINVPPRQRPQFGGAPAE